MEPSGRTRRSGSIDTHMGYNPLRKYRGTKVLDITMLVLTAAALVALVIWAARG